MSEKDQNGYKTKQRQILLDYMRALSGRHVAINDIAAHFADLGEEIGTSTIYRQLNRLVAEGSVKKYVFPGGAAACFQYVGDGDHAGHYHLKCEKCGRLVHLECGLIRDLQAHVREEHDFELDMAQTVFYVLCGECRRKND